MGDIFQYFEITFDEIKKKVIIRNDELYMYEIDVDIHNETTIKYTNHSSNNNSSDVFIKISALA